MDIEETINKFIGASSEEQRRLLEELENNAAEHEIVLPDILTGILPYLEKDVLESKVEDIYDLIGNSGVSRKEADVYYRMLFAEAYEFLDEDFRAEAVGKFDSIFEKVTEFNMDFEDMDVYKRYLEKVLADDEFALTNNSFANHVYQAVQAKVVTNFVFDKNDAQDFSEIFSKHMNIKPAPDMSRYEAFVNSNQSMDEATFDEFVQDLKVLKTSGERLPEKYCDYIFSQKLDPNSVLSQDYYPKYEAIFERAFEDKASHVLVSQGTEKEQLINVTEVSRQNLGGEANPVGRIIFNKRYISSFSNKDTSCINTLFHECRHAKQFDDFKKSDMTARTYMMLKDMILADTLKADGYYNNNYEFFHAEIDARIFGEKNRLKYLKSLGMTEQEILSSGADTNKTYAEAQRDNIDGYSNNLRKYNGQMVDVNDLFAAEVQKNPDIIKKYPILGLEFNEDGTRKSEEELTFAYREAFEEVKQDKTAANRNGFRLMSTIIRGALKVEPRSLLEQEQDIDFSIDDLFDPDLDIDLDYDFENDDLSTLISGLDDLDELSFMSDIHDSVSPTEIQEGRYMTEGFKGKSDISVYRGMDDPDLFDGLE